MTETVEIRIWGESDDRVEIRSSDGSVDGERGAYAVPIHVLVGTMDRGVLLTLKHVDVSCIDPPPGPATRRGRLGGGWGVTVQRVGEDRGGWPVRVEMSDRGEVSDAGYQVMAAVTVPKGTTVLWRRGDADIDTGGMSDVEIGLLHETGGWEVPE